jgi:hypothetical protein
MDLLALMANVYFAVDELARELKDKARTITQSITSNSSKNLPQKSAPNPAFLSLTKHSNCSKTP